MCVSPRNSPLLGAAPHFTNLRHLATQASITETSAASTTLGSLRRIPNDRASTRRKDRVQSVGSGRPTFHRRRTQRDDSFSTPGLAGPVAPGQHSTAEAVPSTRHQFQTKFPVEVPFSTAKEDSTQLHVEALPASPRVPARRDRVYRAPSTEGSEDYDRNRSSSMVNHPGISEKNFQRRTTSNRV